MATLFVLIHFLRTRISADH